MRLEEEHAERLAALRRAPAAGRHRQVIDTAEAMHWFSGRLMRWDTWGEVFQLSVDAARVCGDVRAETVHLNYLTWTSVMCLHRYRRGIELAHDAREPARRIGDAEQEAWAPSYRASGLRYLQRCEKAATAYRQAAGVLAAVGNRPAQYGAAVGVGQRSGCRCASRSWRGAGTFPGSRASTRRWP
ncbi:hypothetical protein [Kitasatospora sp. NPDC051914]|uniref:hypothetical protein n=1 Tax=Kitasatospora sp. NPDC051914 TaxID=3154945 RepID=UPI0034292754